MSQWKQFITGLAPDAPRAVVGEWEGAAYFSDPVHEYDAVRESVALHDRSYRGWIEITGSDRKSWLHNLTTNGVRELAGGEGNYAFAANAQGRILFDLGVVVQNERILLDVDHRWCEPAKEHLNKYIIMEDVQLNDLSASFVRMSLLGPGIRRVFTALGAANMVKAAYWSSLELTVDGTSLLCFRHDRLGVEAFDLVVPSSEAVSVWEHLSGEIGATPVGYSTVDTIRIEEGVPWPLSEIRDDVLPAETGQLEQAVSRNKGCYLGQEVIERMRSRGSQARQLRRIRFDGTLLPAKDSEIVAGEKLIGKVTSSCIAPRSNTAVGLGYLQTKSSVDGMRILVQWEGGESEGMLISDRE